MRSSNSSYTNTILTKTVTILPLKKTCNLFENNFCSFILNIIAFILLKKIFNLITPLLPLGIKKKKKLSL